HRGQPDLAGRDGHSPRPRLDGAGAHRGRPGARRARGARPDVEAARGLVTRLATAAVLLLALVAGACRGSKPKAGPAEAQPTRRGAPPGPVTPEFQAMRSVLSKASALATQK